MPVSEITEAMAQPNMQFQLLYQFPKPSRENTNVVFYCHAGVRSESAAKLARELGFKRYGFPDSLDLFELLQMFNCTDGYGFLIHPIPVVLLCLFIN
jgi:rhodanese-related sulfurtransferase